jgi:hypothetical protein
LASYRAPAGIGGQRSSAKPHLDGDNVADEGDPERDGETQWVGQHAGGG